MELKNVLKKNCMCILQSTDKNEALMELIRLLVESGEIHDIEKTKEQILYRENLMSTGIGLGVGIPHVRIENIDHPIMAIGVSPDGIDNYESIDDDNVWLLVMIIAGEEQHKEYIMLMSSILSKIKSGTTIEDLQEAASAEEIFNILAEE